MVAAIRFLAAVVLVVIGAIFVLVIFIVDHVIKFVFSAWRRINGIYD